MTLAFRLLDGPSGDWATFVPLIGAWSDERLSIARGEGAAGDAGQRLVATARPLSAGADDAPAGPGVFALRWFECRAPDAEEFVELSASAWPAFEASTPGARIFGLFQSLDAPAGVSRLLLCTRYPSLAAWESSRADTHSPQFRRRAELTVRTQVTLWRLG